MPALTREEPAEGGQEGAVDRSVLDATVKLALEHPDLVTEDYELDVLARLTAPGGDEKRQNPAQPEYRREKATAHDGGWRPELPAQNPDRSSGALQLVGHELQYA